MQTEGVGNRHAAAAGASLSVTRTQLCDDVACGTAELGRQCGYTWQSVLEESMRVKHFCAVAL